MVPTKLWFNYITLSMLIEDFEREACKEQIYATERKELLKQAYFSEKKVAKITYKIYETRHNTSSVPRIF